jgi:hypothetical protein
MKKRKWILGISCLMLVAALNFVVLTHSAKANEVENYCYGYYWVHCLSGQYIIRCSCDNPEGPICYASWQGFCDDGGNY